MCSQEAEVLLITEKLLEAEVVLGGGGGAGEIAEGNDVDCRLPAWFRRPKR